MMVMKMVQAPDGTVLNEAFWSKVIGSIPTSYGIFYKDGTYYGECNIPDGTDYQNPNITALINDVVSATSNYGYGTISFQGEHTATLDNTITVDKKYIKFNCNGWNFSTDNDDLDPMFLFKNLDIENQYNRSPYFAGLNDAVLDLNNKAKLGLEVRDCCMTRHNVSFRNVKANATALEVSLETDIIGCYYNKFNVAILGQPYTAITANSIGVLLNKIGAATYEPNHNEFSGTSKYVAYGAKIVNGGTQHFIHFDSSMNTYGFYINTNTNTFTDCYSEGNANPSIITKDGSATILGGMWSVLPTVQSDGTTSGRLVALSNKGTNFNDLSFTSAYNAGLEHRTGEVLFFQTGGSAGFHIGLGDGYLYIKKDGGSDEYKITDTTFDFVNNTIKDPTNEADATLSGTPILVKILKGDVPYYAKFYPTKA
jgi:hypothetical protein